MVSKHGSWFSHGSTLRAQIFHVYLSRIWCPSMGAGSPMGAHPVPRYFMYICLGYGVQAWELVLPWEHTQCPDISCICDVSDHFFTFIMPKLSISMNHQTHRTVVSREFTQQNLIQFKMKLVIKIGTAYFLSWM